MNQIGYFMTNVELPAVATYRVFVRTRVWQSYLAAASLCAAAGRGVGCCPPSR
jgi:hypothetical protein